MAIYIHENKVVSRHWLKFKTNEKVGDKDLYFFSVSGISKVSLKGTSTKWRREKIIINVQVPTTQIPTPPKPNNFEGGYAKFIAKNWTVYAGLNAFHNTGHSINAGNAVDTFRLLHPHNIGPRLQIECDVAVSDTGAYLHRIGFKVDLLLYFDKWQQVIID